MPGVSFTNGGGGVSVGVGVALDDGTGVAVLDGVDAALGDGIVAATSCDVPGDAAAFVHALKPTAAMASAIDVNAARRPMRVRFMRQVLRT
jgi:hypothetical protein